MPPFLLALALLAPSLNASGQATPADRYATGQVWAYRTRPGDEGSLIKIQSIEYDAGAIQGSPIYHISVIGVHFRNRDIAPALPHAPVSRATLDASVTELRPAGTAFPDAAPGIAEWHRARGGVFTASIAQIVSSIDTETAPM